MSAFTSSRRLPEVINWINVRGDLDRKLRDNPILNFLPDGSLNPDRKERKSHLQPVKERRQEMVMNLLYLKYRLRYATPSLPTFTGGD